MSRLIQKLGVINELAPVVRRVDIDTQPAMPIMADGNALGEGRVRIEVRRRVLAVMVGQPAPGPSESEAQTHAAAG